MCETKVDNRIIVKRPDLVKAWNFEKNVEVNLDKVTCGSGRKVWWLCERGHEWEAVIVSRSNGIGCPKCSGRIAIDETCLATVNPELAKEWHPTLNGALLPSHVKPGSNKLVWWKCAKGHEWEAIICKRTKRNLNCRECKKNKKLKKRDSF